MMLTAHACFRRQLRSSDGLSSSTTATGQAWTLEITTSLLGPCSFFIHGEACCGKFSIKLRMALAASSSDVHIGK